MLARCRRYALPFLFCVMVESAILNHVAAAPSTSDLLQKDLKVVFNGSPGVTVPMANGLFIILVHVNDSSYALYFVVDTGSTGSAIYVEVAKGLGIVSTDNDQVRGGRARGMGDGTVSIKIAQQVKLPFTGVTATGVLMALLPHESMLGISHNLGRDCAGILGNDVLRRLIVKIDYTKGCITFSSPRRFVPDPGAPWCPSNAGWEFRRYL